MTVQQLPKGWTMIRFGDIAKQCKESVDRENNPFERYVEGGHMNSEDLRIKSFGIFSDDYVGPAFHRIFRAGQVLYGSRRTYLKKVAIADFDGITSNTTFVIEPKNNTSFIGDLLPYIMLSSGFTKNSITNSKGSTNPYINWSDIAEYRFAAPPISRQIEILQTIKSIRSCIEASENLIDSSDNLDGRLGRKALQLGISNGKTEKKVDGLTSEEWDLVPFEEIMEVGTQNGLYKTKDCYGRGVPIIHMAEMFSSSHIGNKTDISNRVTLNNSELKKNTLRNGDLLFARRSLTPEGAGLCCIFTGHDDPVAFESSIIRVRLDKNLANPEFYNMYFRSEIGRWNMQKLIQTVAASGITSEELKKLLVPFPRKPIQDQVVSLLQSSKNSLSASACYPYKKLLVHYINKTLQA